jgi:hypothetical protein
MSNLLWLLNTLNVYFQYKFLKVGLGSKSYYGESFRDNFFCSSYVQQHRLSTNWGKRTYGMDICRKKNCSKDRKKNSTFWKFFGN